MCGTFVKIDLYGLRQEEAIRVIDKAIASEGPSTNFAVDAVWHKGGKL